MVPAGVPPGETLSPTECSCTCPLCCSWCCSGRSAGPAQRSVPTQNVVRENLGRSTSSSSSHVWKLGTEALFPGQRPTGAVGAVWVVSVLLLSTRGQLDRRAQRSTFVHGHSPGCPLSVPMPCARRPARSVVRRGRCSGRSRNVQVRCLIGVPGARRRRAPAVVADRVRHGSPQPVHMSGDNFSTCRRDGRSMTALCRPGPGIPLSTGFHTTVDSDMSTRATRGPGGSPRSEGEPAAQQPVRSGSRVRRGEPLRGTGATRRARRVPEESPETSSAQRGDGNGWRCGPEDRIDRAALRSGRTADVTAGRGS